jgi:peptide deformylase
LFPDPCLRVKCIACPDDYQTRLEIGNEMIQIMFDNNGLGLSANQVGLDWRMFVMRNPSNENEGLIFCNPEIYATSKDIIEDTEGCLSLLSKRTKVNRFKSLELKFETMYDDISVDILKSTSQRYYEGVWARCIQHEIDHLNGILIFDHINSNLVQKIFLEKYYKAKKRYDRL